MSFFSRFLASSHLQRLLLGLPSLVIAWLIFHNGVNCPIWDQWTEFELFEKFKTGTLSFSDLLQFNNEHRIFFPRLLFLFAYFFEPYTDLVELWITWGLMVLGSIAIYGLAVKTGWDNASGRALLFVSNLLFFNLMAFENWLWGFQIGFALPISCLLGGIHLTIKSQPGYCYFWASICSIVMTFSVAAGCLSWGVLLPLCLFKEGRFQLSWRPITLYLAIAGVAIGIYFKGYLSLLASPNIVIFHPLFAFNFFLAYLGSCLVGSSSTALAAIIGFILLIIYVIALGFLIYSRETEVINRVLPWFSLIHFGLGTAVLTTIGRANLGLSSAVISRYVFFSALVPIGLIFAVAGLMQTSSTLRAWIGRGTNLFPGNSRLILYRGIVAGLISAILLLLFIYSSIVNLKSWNNLLNWRKAGYALLYLDDLSLATPWRLVVMPNFPQFDAYPLARKRLGLGPQLLDVRALDRLFSSNRTDSKWGEYWIEQSASKTVVVGWASPLPNARPVDWIILCRHNPSGHKAILALTQPQAEETSPWP